MGKRMRVVIQGKVQGVYFRVYTQKKASELGIQGWVKNNPDGTVEAVFEGESANVANMVSWCHKGSPHSKVTHVECYSEPFKNDFQNFKILD